MKLLIPIAFFLPFFAFTQNNVCTIDYSYHLDVWKPYTEEVQEYQDSTNSLKSSTYQVGLGTELHLSNKWWMVVGISYKSIHYRVVDQIHTWNFVHTSAGQGTINHDTLTRIYSDPADLVATSDNFGVKLELNYQFVNREKWLSSVGLGSELYGAEFYRATYESTDHSPNDYPESIPSPLIDNDGSFFFSSANLELNYRLRWQFASQFNAGLKLSVGANLYSAWTHFSRNAWIGLGLELGFSRKSAE